MVKHKFSRTQTHKLGIINKTVTATKNTNNKGKKTTIKNCGSNRSRIDLWDNYTYM